MGLVSAEAAINDFMDSRLDPSGLGPSTIFASEYAIGNYKLRVNNPGMTVAELQYVQSLIRSLYGVTVGAGMMVRTVGDDYTACNEGLVTKDSALGVASFVPYSRVLEWERAWIVAVRGASKAGEVVDFARGYSNWGGELVDDAFRQTDAPAVDSF